MRITQRMMVDQLQRNISHNTETLGSLQDQLSSGLRLRRPSDDPPALSTAMKLKVTADQNTQYIRNIDSASGWLSTADTALDQLSSVLSKARDIGLRGATDTNGPQERLALAGQVGSLLEEALQAANSTYNGNRIFAGQQTGTTPFVQAGSTVSYAGDSSPVVIQVGRGVQVKVTIPGDQSVGGPPVLASALQALIDLQTHLAANDTSQLGNDVNALTTSTNAVVSLRGTAGATLNRVDATKQAITTEQTENAILLSRAQDADVAEVMTKLLNQQNVYQAALAAGAKAIQPSLLDYLK